MQTDMRDIYTKVRPIYWVLRRKLLNNNVVSRYIKNGIIAASNEKRPCVICKSNSVDVMRFFFEKEVILKFYCRDCQHIFTNDLQANVEKGFLLFNYNEENKHINDQKYLLLHLEKQTRNISTKSRKFLDFGIGGNYSHLLELNSNIDTAIFNGCDIYPSNREYYFQTYNNESKLGTFDGICSYAVMEHLDDTLNSWKYLNKLLKRTSDGGGIMIHAFPSQITEDYLHWAIKIKSHECLFSKKSLSIVCLESGFELLKIKSSPFVQHPIYIFKKLRDL